MARTTRGEKVPLYEYWSRRAGWALGIPGRFSKTKTHRGERRAARREAILSDDAIGKDENYQRWTWL